MKISIPKNKPSEYFDIKVNGETGRNEKEVKVHSIGRHLDEKAKMNRKTKIKRRQW